ncbi:hypothetical protein [Candidatus Poriferisodalis sp.]|uniref:hypothetical protein n=1 Tax=Candidatus Poriferisodalis sp. TaxID=3101277 RepID=UPI003C704806
MEAPRSEESVSGRLRLQVGEVANADIVDQHLSIARQQSCQRRGTTGVVRQDLFDGVTQQPRFGCHAPGEVSWLSDNGHLSIEEVGEQVPYGIVAASFHGQAPSAVEQSKLGLGAQFSVREPREFQVVGEDEIGQCLAVPLELLTFLLNIEICADVLALDMSDGNLPLLDNEVGRAVVRVCRLVDRIDVFAANILQQLLQRGPVAVLSRSATAESRTQGSAVLGERHWALLDIANGQRESRLRVSHRPVAI